MSGPLGSARRWMHQGVLTVGAILGVGCILVTLGAALFGLRPLVFESGSMSPTIRTGDLAISRTVDASTLETGQIVSVPTGDGSRVTHRIVSVTHEGGDAILRLRGDANEVSDATQYRVSHADRVLFHVPKLGYVVGWLSGPMGLFALGLYAAFLVSVLLGRSPLPAAPAAAPVRLTPEERIVPPSPSGRRARRARGRGRRTMVSGGLSVVLLLGVGAGLGLRHELTPTAASWADASGVSGTSLTGYTVPAPVISSCVISGTGNSRTATFSWTGVTAPPTTYSGAVATITASSAVIGGTASAPTFVVTFSTANGGGNRGKTGNVTITPSVGQGAWSGPSATGTIAVNSSGTATCS